MAQLLLLIIILNRSEVFDGGDNLYIVVFGMGGSFMLYLNICVSNQMTVVGNLRFYLLFAYVLY